MNDSSADSFSPRLLRQAQEGGYRLINAVSLKEQLERGSIFLVDVRDRADYEAGHIPGAICYPLPLTIQARLFKRWWLKKLLCNEGCTNVVFYCQDVNSLRSDSAARAAVISGFPDVYNYPGGLEDWVSRGLALETGPCCEPEHHL
ncbi:rhodanese-like domain-containing protein [Desulfovibrio mangrovi]|uniref:rhodanese-like domain-containing protein n=1 Tax=Desulfovibrio mangrovi TaxID=2976983 RepID=UPI0022459EEF|nr:rhodanese-like domain-containing protein [Desulfovibrio mangrovi]UZP68905.1 rhodanese-like domain-containing protein [Desulfovibrio mangrovi]